MESPDFYIGSYFDAADDNQHSHDSLNFHQNNNNHFTVDDLLDFSKGDDIITDSFCDDHSSLPSFHTSNSSSSSSSGNESHYINSFTDAPFSGNELFVPYNELPELEWISNFENESFSNDELQNFQFISSTAPPTDTSSSQSADEFRPKLASARNYSSIFGMDMSIPGKARSKRSRAPPCDWSSRIQLVNNSSSSKANNGTDPKTLPSKEMEDAAGESTACKCVHCGSVKTPQWRSGPAGPKTLCNACGVRHRSGRLVPEYRPASSPTFVPAKHSNSHRKVVELQRQKEMLVAQQLFTQRSIFSASSGCDYLIRGQSGTNFRQI